MDQEIEQYATKVRGGGVDNSNGYAHNGNNMRQPQEKHVKPQRTVTEYEKWVRRLYATNLFLPVKLGLENMEQLHEALGRPTDRMIIVHIAGTNGKGSVTYKIAKTLREANPNLRVGLFCSPHISSFRERMQVNDELITEDQVVQLLPPIYEICQERDIPGTFFEITTALAFSYYASMKCDVVVLETGLGGRLDATNIVRKPAISIITSIGLEHTRILGDTIELIAVEKGGIIKENCPVLVGPNVPHIVLRQCAKDKKASGYYTCDDVLGLPNKKSTEVEADYDKENARIATAALNLLQKSPYGVDLGIQDSLTDRAIAKGTSQRPPCRFETLQVPLSDDEDENMLTVILDVAHNPPAMDYLKRKLRHSFPSTRIRVVVGMSSDKDMKLCGLSVISVVEGDTSRIHLVEAAHPRAAKLEAILDATGLADTDVHYDLNDRSITTQIRKAKTEIIQRMQQPTKKKVKEPQEVLVVCGSVFLMAEAREALGINEPRDSDVIAELAGAGVRHSQENFGNNKSYEDNMDDGPRNK